MNETESSSALGAVALWVLGVVLVLAGILAALYVTSFDTKYAPGYSESAFKSIGLGDSEQRVLSMLGTPLSTADTEPYVEWIYSADEQRHFASDGEGKGTYTTVRFDIAERVQDIFGVRQTSANSFLFGDGQNFLGLTGAQIEKLKNSNLDNIRQKFGSPRAVYVYKVTRILCYSRSPSSSNYHLRMVGLDKDGNVVQIWREIYWD